MIDAPRLILGSWSMDGFKIVTFHKDNLFTFHAHSDIQGMYSLTYNDSKKVWEIQAIQFGIVNGEIRQIDKEKMEIVNYLVAQGMTVDAAGDLSANTDIIRLARCK